MNELSAPSLHLINSLLVLVILQLNGHVERIIHIVQVTRSSVLLVVNFVGVLVTIGSELAALPTVLSREGVDLAVLRKG